MSSASATPSASCFPLPLTVTLPCCFSPLICQELARSLPRPLANAPADYAAQVIFEAVSMVADYVPRTVTEARLVLQIIMWHFRAVLAVNLAAPLQPVPDALKRGEQHGMSQVRTCAGLERRLAALRRQREKAGGVVAEMGEWEVELASLEAVWRGVELVTAEMLAAAPVTAAKPPAPKVPLWKQNGRQYIHQCTDAEVDELEDAKAKGEAIEWPPYHPRDPVALGWRPDPEPKKPYKYWGDMTKQERLERYGYKTEEQIAAAKAEKAAAEAAKLAEGGEAAAAGG
jgi:hypothetical protein